jgi:hypothetical protein
MMAAGTYLLCWAEQPIGNPATPHGTASHYIGWGADLAHRIGIQEAGNWRAARIMQAVRGQGITFTVAQTWPNTGRDFERALKARKHASRFCPRCQGSRQGAAS